MIGGEAETFGSEAWDLGSTTEKHSKRLNKLWLTPRVYLRQCIVEWREGTSG